MNKEKNYVPVAFLSYARFDDEHNGRRISEFQKNLSAEVRTQTGEPFFIFQDREDIEWGQNWRQRIEESINQTTFLIPVITPSFFKSEACRNELELFLAREKKFKRDDLVLPLYYVDTPLLNDAAKRAGDELAQAIASRQYADWRDLRFEPFSSPVVGKALEKLALQIRAALERTVLLDEPPLEDELENAVKKYELTSLLLLDLDDLSAVNKKYGISIGDEVIHEVLLVVERIIQNKGKLFHRSGDEIVVLLPNFDDTEARYVAERIRATIEQCPPLVDKGVTTSVGLATYPSTCSDWKTLKSAADQAVRQAKKVGKNRVVSVSETVEVHISESNFDVVVATGRRAKMRYRENDIWRNAHQISFLIRPGRRVEVDIAIAERPELKDALSISFAFSGEQYAWDNIIRRLKAFIAQHKIDWLSFEAQSWGDSWDVHGELLTNYFPAVAHLNWLKQNFNPPPAWHSHARLGTSDPVNSSSIEFTLLEP